MKVRDQGDVKYGSIDAETDRYADQPFAAGPDLVLQQVGWIDTLTGRMLRLDEKVSVGDFAKLGRLRAVYEVNGNHYREPGHP